jgi:glutathione S-transferase
MQLHYATGTISIAVAIALEEASMSYEAIRVDFASGQQTTPEYLALNPKGRVPVLITDRGAVLTETGAILEYIAMQKPDAVLVPADPEMAAHMRSVMYYLASTMHVNHAHKMRGHRWANQQSSFDDMTAKVPQTMKDSAAFIEFNAFKGDFVTGNTLSIADPYLYVVCNWLAGDGVKVSDFPRITGFLDRMRTRPSLQKVMSKGMI